MNRLNGWHRGERIVRRNLGYDKIASTSELYSHIDGEMPYEHTKFYTSNLHFLPVCSLDDEGRPWASILSGADGKIGFIRQTKYNTLSIEAKLWEGDPFRRNARILEKGDGMLIAGIGVEFSTRRRNKFAGVVTKLVSDGEIARLELFVNEAIGNCPKYITLREYEPHPSSPAVLYDRPHFGLDERLPDHAIAFILNSDIVYFGSTYAASKEDSQFYPSHLGLNHRGGRPGFMRVKPSDGRTLVLPDFSGNRFMTSLGNVEATPLAALTFISFEIGDILYVTGSARNVYGEASRAVMPFQDTITEIFVTGFTYVQDALPIRQKSGHDPQYSPYNPPIRLLAEETTHSNLFSTDDRPNLLLTRITVHTPTVATFDWEVSTAIQVLPGQAAILDLSPLLGSRRYQHMSPVKPSLVNDDFIRTWTVSSTLGKTETTSLSLTMREKPQGTVTGALFALARKLAQVKPEALSDSRELGLTVKLVGISGDFVLPVPDKPLLSSSGFNMVWIAGGIGVTPFLAMLEAMSYSIETPSWTVTLLVSTREPDLVLSMISKASCGPRRLEFDLHIFTSSEEDINSDVPFVQHQGRISMGAISDVVKGSTADVSGVYLCGPEGFARSIRDLLESLEFDNGRIHSEGFAY